MTAFRPDAIASSDEGIEVLQTLLRLPVHLNLNVEPQVSDEGDNYTLSYPNLRVLGAKEDLVLHEEFGAPALQFDNLREWYPGGLQSLLYAMKEIPIAWVDLGHEEMMRRHGPAVLRAFDRLVECAWWAMLDGCDNMDAPEEPGIDVHPAALLLPAETPVMAAP